ncbi:MAG TPA: hypothetical protein VF912_02825 [Anaeromyxobacter sp.]
MPPRALWLALPLVAGACAAPERRPPHAEAAPTAGVARGRFEPPESEAVFRRAVRAARDAGYTVEICDASRGALSTGMREFDDACGVSTCLSRQSISIVVGHRGVRVTVAREVFDGALRAWAPGEPATLDREAQAVLQSVLPPAAPDARPASGLARRPDDEPGPAAPRSDACAPIPRAAAAP